MPPTLAELKAAVARLVEADSVGFELRMLWSVEGLPDPVAALEALGQMEIGRERAALDFGSFAELWIDGVGRGGPSGTPLTEHHAGITQLRKEPLLLVDLARRAVAASDGGEETVGEEPCHLLRAVVDASPIAADPAVVADWFADPAATALDACIAPDGRLRRLRWASAYDFDFTLELDILDAPVDPEFDWRRFPDWKDETELLAAWEEELESWTVSPLVEPQPDLDARVAAVLRPVIAAARPGSDAEAFEEVFQRLFHDNPVLMAELASRYRLADPGEGDDPAPDVMYLMLWLVEHGDLLHDDG